MQSLFVFVFRADKRFGNCVLSHFMNNFVDEKENREQITLRNCRLLQALCRMVTFSALHAAIPFSLKFWEREREKGLSFLWTNWLLKRPLVVGGIYDESCKKGGLLVILVPICCRSGKCMGIEWNRRY